MEASVEGAIRIALKQHEIGGGTPYGLCFAGKGNSGASFGAFQGDLAAGQPEARDAFKQCLAGAGFSPAETGHFLGKLGVPCPQNPLSAADTARIDAALAQGRAIVDAMDDKIFAGVRKQLQRCIDAAAQAGRSISSEALIYMALWINMTGPPSQLLQWLKGQPVTMAHTPQPAPAVVSGPAMADYLGCTRYYTDHPKNFAHMKECVAAGVAALA